MGSSQRQIGTLYFRLLQAALLVRVPRADLRAFWTSAAAELEMRPDKLLGIIWRLDGHLSPDHHQKLRQCMDDWFQSRGISPELFLRDAFESFVDKPGSLSRVLLWHLRPWLHDIHASSDLRQLLLKLLDELHGGTEERSVRHQLVYQSVRYGWRRDVVLFSWSPDMQAQQPFDYASWVLPLVSQFPRLFGLPPYEEARMLADSRPLPVNASWEFRDGAVWQDGSRIAVQRRFSEVWREYGMELSGLGVPDPQGLQLEVDQGSFRKGVFYGAPVSLVELRYLSALGRKINPLERLVGSLIDMEGNPWAKAEELQELLCDELSSVVELVYHSADDSFSVGDRHIARNVPARILRNVFREYARSGRTEFEHREFRRDPEICMDPANPNFEARLGRLMDRLGQSNSPIHLEKSSKGRFRVISGVRIRYFED